MSSLLFTGSSLSWWVTKRMHRARLSSMERHTWERIEWWVWHSLLLSRWHAKWYRMTSFAAIKHLHRMRIHSSHVIHEFRFLILGFIFFIFPSLFLFLFRVSFSAVSIFRCFFFLSGTLARLGLLLLLELLSLSWINGGSTNVVFEKFEVSCIWTERWVLHALGERLLFAGRVGAT